RCVAGDRRRDRRRHGHRDELVAGGASQNGTLKTQSYISRSALVIAAELSKISADSHIDEPHDLWFERMDADLRDRAPRRIQAERDGGWSLVIDDSRLGWSDLSAEEATANESARLAAAAPDIRLEMMRTDGVNAEIIYPTIGLYVWNIEDPTVGRAACAVYNDWILERLGGMERVRIAAMIPTSDVDMAIAA